MHQWQTWPRISQRASGFISLALSCSAAGGGGSTGTKAGAAQIERSESDFPTESAEERWTTETQAVNSTWQTGSSSLQLNNFIENMLQETTAGVSVICRRRSDTLRLTGIRLVTFYFKFGSSSTRAVSRNLGALGTHTHTHTHIFCIKCEQKKYFIKKNSPLSHNKQVQIALEQKLL